MSTVTWVGVVRQSELVAALDHGSAAPARLTHWIILLKEETAEVVGSACEVLRS
ncbi:MAG: hypothetical protein QM804_18915 [Propionicimonas sp.]